MIMRPAGKRRSGKVSPTSPTLKSKSPATTPVVGSKWHVAARQPKRPIRKPSQIVLPSRSATSAVLVDTGDALGGELIHEEPVDIPQPQTSQLPPARQGPVRTRPYEAPYFFPTPGSPEAIGYVDRVREERRTALLQPDPTSARKKRSYTMSSIEKDETPGSTRLHGSEGSHDQATGDTGKKQPRSPRKGCGSKNSSPSSSPSKELDVRARTPIPRKSSAPAQLSSSGTLSTPATPNRRQVQRQGSQAIMRMLGKH